MFLRFCALGRMFSWDENSCAKLLRLKPLSSAFRIGYYSTNRDQTQHSRNRPESGECEFMFRRKGFKSHKTHYDFQHSCNYGATKVYVILRQPIADADGDSAWRVPRST